MIAQLFPVTACRAVLFDLDGTLVDSVPDLAAAVDGMLRQLQLPEAGESQVRNWVGNGMVNLIQRALTGDIHFAPDHPALQRFDEALPLFQSSYDASNGQFSRLYEGVAVGLRALQQQGLRLAVVTNKPERFTLPLLEQLGIADCFSVIIGGDTLPQRKPDPAPLLEAARRLQVEPAACLMVGDSRHDIEAARNTGMKVVAVPYGYNHGDDISLSQPDQLVSRIDQLVA